MNLEEHIISQFHQALDVNVSTIETCTPSIALAGKKMAYTLTQEKKIISCGNGTAAVLCQHFTNLMMHRLDQDRPGLPVICLNNDSHTLSGISEDNSFNAVYSKPIRALGQAQDILLILSTQARSSSLIQAIQAAHERDMHVIALTTKLSTDIKTLLDTDDIEISAPTDHPVFIQNAQLLILQSLCKIIDLQLFGQTSYE